MKAVLEGYNVLIRWHSAKPLMIIVAEKSLIIRKLLKYLDGDLFE